MFLEPRPIRRRSRRRLRAQRIERGAGGGDEAPPKSRYEPSVGRRCASDSAATDGGRGRPGPRRRGPRGEGGADLVPGLPGPVLPGLVAAIAEDDLPAGASDRRPGWSPHPPAPGASRRLRRPRPARRPARSSPRTTRRWRRRGAPAATVVSVQGRGFPSGSAESEVGAAPPLPAAVPAICDSPGRRASFTPEHPRGARVRPTGDQEFGRPAEPRMGTGLKS